MKKIKINSFKDILSIRLYDNDTKINIAKMDRKSLVDYLQNKIDSGDYKLERLGRDKLDTIIFK